jgi:hypothetical protein
MREKVMKYILVHQYHDTFVDEFNSLSELRLALTKLKETFKYDGGFKYKVYRGEDITGAVELIDELEEK